MTAAQMNLESLSRLCKRSAAMILLIWCSLSHALGGNGSLGDLRLTVWGARDGAPSASSTAIAQTPDGYLWLSDHSGLYRFDAARFERVDLREVPQLSFASVYSLYAPPTGGLWIGYSLGGAVFLKDGHAVAYGEKEGLPIATVRAISQQPDGTVWIATTQGLGRLENGRWKRVGADAGLSETIPRSLLVDSTGALWMRTDKEVYRRAATESKFSLIRKVSRLSYSIAEAASGSVWISDGASIYRVWKNRPGGRNIAASNSNLIVDDEGALWYLNDETTNFQRALIRLPQPELRLKGEHLLIENEADRLDSIDGRSLTGFGALLTDHEGNVWASYGPGVARFSLRVLRPIKLEKDRPSGGVLTTIGAVNGGGVVISSDGNSNFTYLVHDGRVRRVKLPSAFLECLSRVRSGKTWLATQDGLWRWTDGQFVKAMSVDGLGTKRVRAIAEDGSGALWVSIVRSGIFKRVGNSWQLNGGVSALPNLAPLSLTDDSAGSIWATYPDGRAIQISGEVAHIYGELDGLNVGAVLAVYAKRRNTWVGGDAGLARLDGGRFVSVVSDEPAALKKITGIVETESGDLWLSTAAGIVHITSTEILRAQSDPLHRVSTEIFDSRTGLEGSGARFASLPTLIEGTDGILWVVTSVSTYSIDPNKVHRSPLPPKVSIQSFLVDNRAVATSGNVMLPVGSSSIQFSFAGLSLTAAEQVRYRYRLDGFDHDWVSSQKRRDAFYMNLSPGTYTFHVQARISGVQWSESEASVTFNIEPTFTQTKSFIVLILTGALLIIWIVDGIRARKLARQLRIALVARLEERERIAQELHDTLLQDTMGFTLTVHGAASRLAADDPVRKLLEQAAEQGEQGVRQGRDRIADLRARSAEDDDLAKSLTEAGAQWIAEDGKTDFEVQTLGRTRSLHPNAHDDAYRIAREAIINARRHARARHIQVQLIFGEDLFTLRVRDDGGGIDPSLSQARARAGHMGLPGMRQRAGAAGGTLTIQSEAGGGTEVEFNLAAALAYWQPLGRAPWRAWRSVCGWLARRRVRTTPPVEPESTE